VRTPRFKTSMKKVFATKRLRSHHRHGERGGEDGKGGGDVGHDQARCAVFGVEKKPYAKWKVLDYVDARPSTGLGGVGNFETTKRRKVL